MCQVALQCVSRDSFYYSLGSTALLPQELRAQYLAQPGVPFDVYGVYGPWARIQSGQSPDANFARRLIPRDSYV